MRSVSVAYNATLGVLAKDVQLARGATARHPVNSAVLVQADAAVFVNEGQCSLLANIAWKSFWFQLVYLAHAAFQTCAFLSAFHQFLVRFQVDVLHAYCLFVKKVDS